VGRIPGVVSGGAASAAAATMTSGSADLNAKKTVVLEEEWLDYFKNGKKHEPLSLMEQ
jgi:hypothetical protein